MEGNLIEATFDTNTEELTIHSIKHVETHTVLTSAEARALYNRLDQQSSGEDTVITVNDQFPILLTVAQREQIKRDLSRYIGLQ
ncbi:hypothetical protein [Ectobacillus panaciterrae]|uniref:hypothetical protein n=1 Tax=Ectobacillus panaciterrae TaxID=363872 RepID=UPI000416E12D|nr:hypothetical protein [Ectobacillus panaciterrae]